MAKKKTARARHAELRRQEATDNPCELLDVYLFKADVSRFDAAAWPGCRKPASGVLVPKPCRHCGLTYRDNGLNRMDEDFLQRKGYRPCVAILARIRPVYHDAN